MNDYQMFPKPRKKEKGRKGFKRHPKARGKENITTAQRQARRHQEMIYRDYAKPEYLAELALRQGRAGKQPLCEIEMTCEGKRIALQIHHKRGRLGSLVHDKEHFAGTCDKCHRWIHDNPKMAKAYGWIESRNEAPDEVQEC